MDSSADIETLKAALIAERARAAHADAELALARAQLSDTAATIARQSLEIAKLRRQIYGPLSERTARLIEQMELALEELEADATEDEIAAERAAARTSNVAPFTRNRPSRSRSLNICRASASSFPRQPPATAAAARGSGSSARRSPRRWR